MQSMEDQSDIDMFHAARRKKSLPTLAFVNHDIGWQVDGKTWKGGEFDSCPRNRRISSVLGLIITVVKFKGLDIYIFIILLLTGKPKLEWFTIWRWHSAVSGCPLPERMDFGPAVAARQTYLCPSRTMAFTLQCSLATTRCFVVASITRYLRGMEGWVGWVWITCCR